MPKIAIYAGHGGNDHGATGNDKREKDLNLEISIEITRILRTHGYEIINNRTDDSSRNTYTDAIRANSENVDAIIEIHMNSHHENLDFNGTTAIYSTFDKSEGKNLAMLITNNISTLGFSNNGAKTRSNAHGRDHWGIIRLTKATAVLVEVAYISNVNDMAKFNVSPISQAIADSIMQILPLPSPIVSEEPLVENPPITNPPIIHQTVRFGSRNETVQIIQKSLNTKGYSLKIDGIFGSITESKLKAFQNDNSLIPDGIADPKTQKLLFV
jgi:N-acetylmuramoyl-L-alanine amidase